MRQETNQLQSIWKKRITEDFSQEDLQKQQSILRWLLGEDVDHLNSLMLIDLDNINQIIEFRYYILRRHYLDVKSSQAYRHLITRLTSLVMGSSHLRSWGKKNPNHQKEIIEIVQAVIQEILEEETALQKSINWIAKCTQNRQLREAFLLASLEEYCCRTIRNQPLLIYHLRNFLWKKSSKNSRKNLGLNQDCA